ncbi:GDYXXLXY domain-containing protein [Stappia sp.]|uniref:GDYXXLXY domain-containing protein n=1 Tax=Stappia sp. TaxID=1870903 RepID=UPI003A9A1E97
MIAKDRKERRLSPWILWSIAALVQLALIALPLGERLFVHAMGTEVTLALRPVDPRDLLRGDYVIINLEIERVELPADRQSRGTPQVGDTVWTLVEPDGQGVFRAVDALSEEAPAGRIALRGVVRRVADVRTLIVDYGIDAFFVPEGAGLEIERAERDSVRLVVAVTADGSSAPLHLVSNGEVLLSDGAF